MLKTQRSCNLTPAAPTKADQYFAPNVYFVVTIETNMGEPHSVGYKTTSSLNTSQTFSQCQHLQFNLRRTPTVYIIMTIYVHRAKTNNGKFENSHCIYKKLNIF